MVQPFPLPLLLRHPSPIIGSYSESKAQPVYLTFCPTKKTGTGQRKKRENFSKRNNRFGYVANIEVVKKTKIGYASLLAQPIFRYESNTINVLPSGNCSSFRSSDAVQRNRQDIPPCNRPLHRFQPQERFQD